MRTPLRAATLLIICLPLCFAAGASAATITIGPNLNGLTTGTHLTCEAAGGCTFSQAASSYAAPVAGVIVRWRVIDSTGPFTLRVVEGKTGIATGATATATSTALQEFPAALPIKAGQQIALDLPESGSSLGYKNLVNTSIGYWSPPLGDGQVKPPNTVIPGFQLLFNADIQPPPGITALAPASGPIKVANTVVVTGHDFSGASAVRFGTQEATKFSVDSDTQITAVAPVSLGRASVPVSVTTIAGSATSTQNFDYTACLVPKLNGKKLKGAKKALKAANCKLGKVTKRNGATAKSGKVVKQGSKPKKLLAPGTRISVVLGR